MKSNEADLNLNDLDDLDLDLDLEADLTNAFRSVRDEYDGTNPDSDLTLQRALFRTRKKTQKQRLTHWILLPAAAVLIASTAFAGVTGRLQPAMRTVLDTLHGTSEPKKAPPPPPAPTPTTAKAPDPTPAPIPEPTSVVTPPAEPEPAIQPATTPKPITITRAIPKAPLPPPVVSEQASATPPVAPNHLRVGVAGDSSSPLFAEAHRLHFIDRDPARALVAWDRYLASGPDPKFAPEARYNRALTLVRIGRLTEAKRELEPFASGSYGPYHREDAKALLDRLNQ